MNTIESSSMKSMGAGSTFDYQSTPSKSVRSEAANQQYDHVRQSKTVGGATPKHKNQYKNQRNQMNQTNGQEETK